MDKKIDESKISEKQKLIEVQDIVCQEVKEI